MKKLLALILLLAVLGCQQNAPEIIQEPIKQNNGHALDVAELRHDAEYGAQVKVQGVVSNLGELLCPCFTLTSGGDYIDVWYDLMVQGKVVKPAVNVEGISNGDNIIVTGELMASESTNRTFWPTKIEKIN
ncbi:hypothetical protein KY311_04625 [Candidatus Woesearchaeota archaeon]|nr:hypothetical protein [Candidatus Woesearchaeota archaeon]